MSSQVPDGDPMFTHTAEGPDDMAAHVRSVLTGSDLNLPVRDGRCAPDAPALVRRPGVALLGLIPLQLLLGVAALTAVLLRRDDVEAIATAITTISGGRPRELAASIPIWAMMRTRAAVGTMVVASMVTR